MARPRITDTASWSTSGPRLAESEGEGNADIEATVPVPSDPKVNPQSKSHVTGGNKVNGTGCQGPRSIRQWAITWVYSVKGNSPRTRR